MAASIGELKTGAETVPSSEEATVSTAVGTMGDLRRKVHRLWPEKGEKSLGLPVHFRVNFHEPGREGKIIKSAFVTVHEGKASVEWEVQEIKKNLGSVVKPEITGLS